MIHDYKMEDLLNVYQLNVTCMTIYVCQLVSGDMDNRLGEKEPRQSLIN